MKSTHEVLVAARNLLDREGWVQGSYHHGGGFCARGACHVAVSGGRFAPSQDGLAAIQVLEEICPRLLTFNDAPGRTKEEILGVFDKAIAQTAPEPQDPFTEDDFAHTPDAVAIP